MLKTILVNGGVVLAVAFIPWAVIRDLWQYEIHKLRSAQRYARSRRSRRDTENRNAELRAELEELMALIENRTNPKARRRRKIEKLIASSDNLHERDAAKSILEHLEKQR